MIDAKNRQANIPTMIFKHSYELICPQASPIAKGAEVDSVLDGCFKEKQGSAQKNKNLSMYEFVFAIWRRTPAATENKCCKNHGSKAGSPALKCASGYRQPAPTGARHYAPDSEPPACEFLG